MNELKFTKMHGLGNDFFLIDNRKKKINNYGELAKVLCDRKEGLEVAEVRGADGILYILPSEIADYRMRIFNPNGSEAEMCGNGIRCFAKYLYDKDLTDKEELEIETLAGIIKPKLNFEKGEVKSVTVDMGKGRVLEKDKQVKICDERGSVDIIGHHISIGNPHYVILGVPSEKLEEYGPLIESHSAFQPEKTNVEFAQILKKDLIRMYVWERGAGHTKACATGACATAFISRKFGLVDENVTVLMEGGDLNILAKDNDTIFMTGPAEYQGDGEIDVDKLLENIV